VIGWVLLQQTENEDYTKANKRFLPNGSVEQIWKSKHSNTVTLRP
jgi:hypothetical protein